MNKLLILLLLPSTVCFLMAGILAYNSLDGWGWLIFGSWLILSGVIAYPEFAVSIRTIKSSGDKP
jgi:hypothetical protein